MNDINNFIKNIIENNKIVLFMKGTKQFPMCGFSSKAVQILKECNLEDKDCLFINVLENSDLREGIKKFSNWPTIPQLYINGEFIGGSDIMLELQINGDLSKILQNV